MSKHSSVISLYRRMFKRARLSSDFMVIRGSVREKQPSYPGIRNIVHKISRFLGLSLLLSVSASAQTQPLSVREFGPGFGIDIAAGRKSGYSSVHKFGYNPACSTTEEDVWAGGGQYQFQLATSVVKIAAGGNAADTAAGTGARKIQIEGLGTDWYPASAILDTDGANASLVSTVAFIRVNRAFVVDIGTYSSVIASGANVGDITIVSTSTGHTAAIIAATKGQTQLAIYTVPEGKVGWLLGYHASVSATKSTSVSLYRRENADDVTSPFSSKRLVSSSDELQGVEDIQNILPIRLGPKADIWATCRTATGASVASVTFDIVLENK